MMYMNQLKTITLDTCIPNTLYELICR